MRQCLFCDNPAGNAEHVIAEWLSKAMQRRHGGVVAAARNKDGVIKSRPPTRFQSMTLKKVCQQCNNGWMSKLEANFKSEFEHLVAPRAFDDAETVKTLMKAQWDLLVRWLLKSAVVAEHALPRGEQQKFPPELQEVQNLDLSAHGFFVYAGEIMEPNFTLLIRKGYRTFNNGEYHENQVCKEGFNLSIQMNHLALSLINCPSAMPGVKSPYSIDGVPVMPLIPSREVDWGTPVSHLFKSFDDFIDSIEVYATTPNEQH